MPSRPADNSHEMSTIKPYFLSYKKNIDYALRANIILQLERSPTFYKENPEDILAMKAFLPSLSEASTEQGQQQEQEEGQQQEQEIGQQQEQEVGQQQQEQEVGQQQQEEQ